MGKKNASARIKNKVKKMIARSIAHMEKTIGKERQSYQVRHHKKSK
ncbi:hypothetical protein KBB68_02545 [Candidatus Babeliales bacterium]|nr:hypothetical protein [Candidatus Babeliales bacterium]